jgi:uncharacterized repeat protein (TIGR01451 family)
LQEQEREIAMLKLLSLLVYFCIFAGFYFSAFARQDKLENFCTNGGFEELNPQGYPLGWGGFGEAGASSGASSDAHSGDYALFLKSTSGAIVGVNLTQDTLIPIVRGIARFWYKALYSQAEGKNLQVFVIAMNETGDEEVGRKLFIVPPEHVGDGEWHQAEIEFDFTAREDAKQVHFAPRINETTAERADGEFLLDDVEVTRIGPKLKITEFGVAKPLIRVGETVEIRLHLKNVGDEDAVNVQGKLLLPPGMTVESGDAQSFQIERIKTETVLSWQVKGSEPVSGALEVVVGSLSSAFYLTVADVANPQLTVKNKHIRLDFYKTEHGYGIFSIGSAGSNESNPLAQSSMLGSLAYKRDSGAIERVSLFADEPEQQGSRFIFRKRWRDFDNVLWNFEFIFHLPPGQKWADVSYKATADRKREILGFHGPILYISRQDQYDAIFPGLEYLEGDEFSSSTLDIVPPNHIRRVPHPNKITVPLMAISRNTEKGTTITGMMWNAKQEWSKGVERPSALFASPNWTQAMNNYSVIGLFIPSVPDWVDENETEAQIPYNLQPGENLGIEAQLFSIHNPETDVSAVYSIPYWIEKYGLPDPLSLPRGTLEKEMEFSLIAYMDTLWVPEEEAWHNTLDWDPWGVRVNPEFAHHLWLAAKILPESAKRDEYIDRAELAFEKLGDNPGRELVFYTGKLDEMYPRFKGRTSALIQSQEDDGSWRFDPDHLNAIDQIHKQDYHKLGNEGDVEVGLCAIKAYELLRYASMTGDEFTLKTGLKTLDFMRRFKIPRAAQVWEVPVHTPDVLASAHAIKAYLEAYKITREDSYLDAAVYWAHTGLPFVYLWNKEDIPSMLYGSIPVFGATWYTHSWFGVAVQWNGLDYAHALFDLAEYDNSLPWMKIARGLTVSALYQQETSEKYEGLYPDSFNFMDKSTSAWKLAPGGIVRNLFVLMGYTTDPVTAIIHRGDGKVHITAAVSIQKPELSKDMLRFSLNYPPDMDGYVMIAGLDKPEGDSVKMDLPKRDWRILQETTRDLNSVPEGWKYDQANGILFMKLRRDSGKMDITISNPVLKYVPQLLPPVEEINWHFESGGLRYWTAVNDLTQLSIHEGALVTRSTGADPYMISMPMKIDASGYSQVTIRMRTSKGRHAQFFWSTETEPISEATSIRFEIRSDGKFHDYVMSVGQHAKWKGIITGLRLDPTDSSGSEIGVKSIIGH